METLVLASTRFFVCYNNSACLSVGGLLYIMNNFTYLPIEKSETKFRHKLNKRDIEKLMKWSEDLKKYLKGMARTNINLPEDKELDEFKTI